MIKSSDPSQENTNHPGAEKWELIGSGSRLAVI
jgi:hypothetical protein